MHSVDRYGGYRSLAGCGLDKGVGYCIWVRLGMRLMGVDYGLSNMVGMFGSIQLRGFGVSEVRTWVWDLGWYGTWV